MSISFGIQNLYGLFSCMQEKSISNERKIIIVLNFKHTLKNKIELQHMKLVNLLFNMNYNIKKTARLYEKIKKHSHVAERKNRV